MNSLGVNRPVPEIIADMLTNNKGNKIGNLYLFFCFSISSKAAWISINFSLAFSNNSSGKPFDNKVSG